MIAELLDDDIRLNTPETGISHANPYPGIRSFEFTEAHLYFGQEFLCDQVLTKLKENRFACILGGAGVGKTSLINCGIKPALFSNTFSGLKSPWHIFHLQPGKDPILNLARCISKSKKVEFFEEDRHIREQVCCHILRRGRQGLVEVISQLSNTEGEEFLFIIDQFEDLFRLRSKNESYAYYEEAAQYVDLLLDALKSSSVRVQIIVSIRSDFTDDCILFPALAELINRSNVVVPKMNRDQIKDAVLGPLRIFKVQIEESLLSRILNDAAISDDVLPRLQHAMHQTWKLWLSQSNWNKPITLKDYEATGGINNSISVYANSIYESLDESDKQLAEAIFKTLTERGSENKGFSIPVTAKELSLIGKADVADVWRVINIFRSKDVKILLIEDNECRPDGNVNLVHVSLIRSWDKLKAWVEDEAISGQMYKQLSETSSSYLTGKTGLLRPPDLHFALNWKEKQKPNLEWAKRYNPAFERTMVYLSTSLEAYHAEEELKKLQVKKTQRKVRSLFMVLGATLFIAVALMVFSQISKSTVEKQKDIALEQKEEALEKSVKAELMSKEAVEEKIKAENAANVAERIRQQIEEESKVLAEQKQNAELTAMQAVKKSAQTEQNMEQLSAQKQEIEKSALKANQDKSEAEKEAEAAFNKRMVTTAQTLAVKSLQIQNNKALKSLLSVYAYRLNEHYGGPDIQPDIYNSLLSAASDLGLPYRYSLNGHIGAVNALCVLGRSNIMYSTGGDGKVYSWNISETSPSPRLIAALNGRNLSIAVSPNGKWLAVGSDIGNIRLLDLASLSVVAELKGHNGAVFSLAFSKDAHQLFSSSSDKKILLWDLDSYQSKEIYNESFVVRALSISPDGRFLAGGADDGRLLVWDIKSNQMTVLSSEIQIPIYSLAFNSTGTILATGDLKGNVRLWNPFSRKLVRNLKSHNARVVDIKFSQTGDLMVSASYDGTAYVFDSKLPGMAPQVIKEPSAYIMSAVFGTNNQRIFLARNKADNLVSLPGINSVLATSICSRLSRNLSTDEWNNYIGSDVKYEKPCE